MPSLLLIIFALQLAIHLINSIGASTVSEIAWSIYNQLPTPTSGAVQKAATQKKELLKLKTELKSVSPQDDFARWAKLDRQHNKLDADYQKTTQSLSSAKSQFTTLVGTLRWLGTTGARFAIQFWFQKAPLFWLPRGWLPFYAEWLLAFPRAPLGAISIQVWGMACMAVITLVSEALVAAVAVVTGQTTDAAGAAQRKNGAREKKVPVGVQQAGGGAKKEL